MESEEKPQPLPQAGPPGSGAPKSGGSDVAIVLVKVALGGLFFALLIFGSCLLVAR
jgi:hypothetical protein